MPRSKQQGVALFVCLIMLLIMTLIGVSSVQTSTLEVKMSANTQDNLLAFQAAETGLRAAERLAASVSLTNFGTVPGYYMRSNPGDSDIWRAIDWLNPASGQTIVLPGAGINNVAQQPRYIIEQMGIVLSQEDTLNQDNYGSGTGAGQVQMFRITSIGIGGSPNARVMLQSTFGRRINGGAN